MILNLGLFKSQADMVRFNLDDSNLVIILARCTELVDEIHVLKAK